MKRDWAYILQIAALSIGAAMQIVFSVRQIIETWPPLLR